MRAAWALRGARAASILADRRIDEAGKANLTGTDLPIAFVRWVIRNEWVQRLSDLVERRLMLLCDRRLSEACLRELAALLVEGGLLAADGVDSEVARTINRLETHFGKRLAGEN